MKTQDDDDFLSGLLGEFDHNIPAPVSRSAKRSRSPPPRRVRVQSPSPEPITKKKKVVDDRLPSPPAPDMDDDFIMPMDDPVPSDIPMSDPAPSSPAAKAAERRAQIKEEPKDEDEEDMMEISHAGGVSATSVNITGSRPPKKEAKAVAYPTPASSSPPEPTPAAAEVDSSSWNELTSKLNVITSSQGEGRAAGKIDYQDAIEEDGSLNMFWTDYTEVNGSLCLFGKVLNKKTKSYVSCFVKVDNILRKLYFLPRSTRFANGVETDEEVTLADVFGEVDEIMTDMRVDVTKAKKCTRKYAFELQDVPKEAEYLKLLYPYTSRSRVHNRKQHRTPLTRIRTTSGPEPAGKDVLSRFRHEHGALRTVCSLEEHYGPLLAEDQGCRLPGTQERLPLQARSSC